MTRFTGVIDIGKTNAKCAVVDLETLTECAVETTPNTPISGPPYTHFDTDALWAFIKSALSDLNRTYPIDAISITTHGACAALVRPDGELALPVLDYESTAPETSGALYDDIRPPFSRTYSPRLPLGLNLGAQFHYLATAFADAFGQAGHILTWPQYWAWRLTGIAASEPTSLGCHTDLWDPAGQDLSALVDTMGWRSKFPPVHKAFDLLGPVTDEIASTLGLEHPVPVACGIHDSNASLLPYLLKGEAPFSIVSSGTWIVVFSPHGTLCSLDEQRDCLANVDVFGRPTPSARFMGGREFEMLTQGRQAESTDEAIARVLGENLMLLPSVQQGSGPYPDRAARWSPAEPAMGDPARWIVASFYCALMTARCLELTGGEGEIFVEGPFAGNGLYCRMLASATDRTVANAPKSTGTSIGAALLADWPNAVGHARRLPPELTTYPPEDMILPYARTWRSVADRRM